MAMMGPDNSGDGDPDDGLESLLRGMGDRLEEPTGACLEMIEQVKSWSRLLDVPGNGYDPEAPTALGRQYPVTDELVGQRFGDYELERFLGRGGMGVVYEARQISLDRPVALKLIRSGQFASTEEIERFEREARAAARLDHRHIVPVFDAGEVDGQPFFAMAYVEGRTLEEELHDGPLESRRAAEVVRTLAEAVSHAHAERIVHRDLKPANVIVDKSGEPRILDFGIAKVLDAEDGGRTRGPTGTPRYMSYEQAWQPAKVDERTDVYGLGAILYHLLTGRPPFQAANVHETLRQIRENEPPTPRSVNPAIDRDLQRICLRCLRREQDERYPTAAELAADLDRYLNGEPVSGVGTLSVLKSVVRRNWRSQDLVATRHIALLGAGFMSLPHLLIFGLVQSGSADWSVLSSVLWTTWVLHAVAVVVFYAPGYWGLEIVERVSGFLWLGVILSQGLLFGLLSISRPHTEATLLREWYPLAALAVGGHMFGMAAFDGRVLLHALAWFTAAFVMLGFPDFAPLLYAGLAGPALLHTWFELRGSP